jgi:acetoin utilization deacetylase AcuC-like enzyme
LERKNGRTLSRSAGATIAAAKTAMKEGVSGNLAGGTHHAYRNIGSGFCVFNDSAIAARTLQKEVNPKIKVAIIDLDVHQGNGTASILQNDSTIFTLSIHGENNFPFKRETSDLDLGLADECDDQTYLTSLAKFARSVRVSLSTQLCYLFSRGRPS